MSKKEKNDILAECAFMSDDELEERRKYENSLCQLVVLADLICSVCESLGIELWDHVEEENE